jgi:hypothetical protein
MAEHIHSVRINPFYLPPDTPIARDPAAFGIRLTEFDKGWWRFESENGDKLDPGRVKDRIERVAHRCATSCGSPSRADGDSPAERR